MDKSSFDEESELPIERINSTAENYYKSVFENKDIVKLISLISTCITAIKRDVLRGTDQFAVYQFIWVKNRQTDLQEFMLTKPQVSDFDTRIKYFDSLTSDVTAFAEYIAIGAIALVTETLKNSLVAEIKLWKNFYGHSCNQRYKVEINEILLFIEDIVKKLQRQIVDLDDIRKAMNAL